MVSKKTEVTPDFKITLEGETKSLNDRLAAIQVNLKAPKSNENKFGKYKYRSCEDILEAVKPLLNGCTLVINDEIVLIGERYYVKATAFLGYGKDTIVSSAYAREDESKAGMAQAQLTGATSSYARKYALNGLFAIDDTKDHDTMDNQQTTQKTNYSEPQRATAPLAKADALTIQSIIAITPKKGRTLDGLFSYVRATYKKDINDLSQAQADALLASLQKAPSVTTPPKVQQVTDDVPEVEIESVDDAMEAWTK